MSQNEQIIEDTTSKKQDDDDDDNQPDDNIRRSGDPGSSEEEEENVHQGIHEGSKRCSMIGFKHNKRMYYLRLKNTDKEIQKMSKEQQKKLLKKVKETINKAISDNEVDDIAFSRLKDFEKNFGKKPSVKDFQEIDKELDQKCSNIIDLHPFLPENPAEMGGHPGAFVNVYVENPNGTCDIWGGKKWVDDSVTEYEFYQYLYKKGENIELFKKFQEYIPEFRPDSKCKPVNPMNKDKKKVLDKMNFYFPISNALNGVREGNERIHAADFKIGYRTAFLHEKGKSKVAETRKRDEHQSISDKVGFRTEGSSLVEDINNISPKISESGWHETTWKGMVAILNPQKSYRDPLSLGPDQKPEQYKMYLLNPGFVFDTMFYNTPDQHIIDFGAKLKKFEKDVIEKNFEAFNGDKTPALAFIGCSLFLVSGGGGIDFKLIDFAHPYVLASTQDTVPGGKNPDGSPLKTSKRLADDDKSCCVVNKYAEYEHGMIFTGSSQFNKLGVPYDYDKKKAKKMMKNTTTNANFDWKVDIDFHRWRHTFENFMGGLISFVYSFHFWANSRLHYKLKTTKETKHNQLIEEFNSYNKFFGPAMNEPKKGSKGEKNYDPPYPWAIEHKEEKLKTLIDMSLSNLSRIPN